MDKRSNKGRHERGAALLMALSMLILFSMLGVSSVRFMMIELDETHYDLDQVRMRQMAYAGVTAGIGTVLEALKEDSARPKEYAVEYPLNLPEYTPIFEGGSDELMLEREDQKVIVKIVLVDHSGGWDDVLERFGVADAALEAVRSHAPTAFGQEVRFYYIRSEHIRDIKYKGKTRVVSSLAGALVQFGPGEYYKIRFWREEFRADGTDDSGEEATGQETGDGNEAPEVPDST